MKVLSEKDQQLLAKHFDGEVSWFEKFKIKKLLTQKSAQDYIAELTRIRSGLSQLDLDIKVDLWNRISKRISEEDRAALYLGKRNIVVSRFSFAPVYAGAAVAAAIAIMLNFMPAQNRSVKNEAAIIPLQIVPSANLVRDVSFSDMEVDWMRSDGRVKMIGVPNKRSGVIWVKRKNPDLRSLQGK